MKYAIAALAAAFAVQASPFPQAVTSAISPSAAAPSGCSPNYSGTFGIAVMNVTTAAEAKAAISTISDGQPQATTGTAAAVSTLSDGQPQATTGTASAVVTISDGQPQASTGTATAVATISDGQPQEATSSVAAVTQISDGQIQATTMTMMPVNQITDGQIQNTVPAVKTISDGQPQVATSTASAVATISDGQPQASTGTASAVATLSDGQPQASTGSAVATLSDGQPQASTGSAVATLSDGQPQASTSATATGSAAAASGTMMVACKASDTLQITLTDGVLMDNIGRTGYIAANYQFQFDGPPQAGAIYTAGFSVCGNGSLALGGSTTFYQCLSGDFYNLYDRDWAAQCSPITINTVELVDC